MRYRLNENHPHSRLLAEVADYLLEKQVKLVEPGVIQIRDKQYFLMGVEDSHWDTNWVDSFPPTFDYKLVYEE